MGEPDRLSELLKEWKQPEPSRDLERRVAAGYSAATSGNRSGGWRRILAARVSIPVPVLALAALVLIALLLWIRPSSVPPAPTMPAQMPHPGGEQNVVTSLSAQGFQPLPDGTARVVSDKELR